MNVNNQIKRVMSPHREHQESLTMTLEEQKYVSIPLRQNIKQVVCNYDQLKIGSSIIVNYV